VFHRINFPNCRDQLHQILQFQRQVLEMVCDPNVVLPITESQIKQRFTNQDAADWLWKKLWKNSNPRANEKSDLHQNLEKIILYLRSNTSMSQSILDAFINDASFDQHLNNPLFRFNFQLLNLNTGIKKVITELMKGFYDLLESGFPVSINQGQEDFSRDSFVASFWDANKNLGVCSACDGQRPDSINGKVFCSVDHFFPKAKFPFLSVHPANLTPICHQCNSSFKGEKEPININANESLLDTFHPYERPAIENIFVVASRNNSGNYEVSLNDVLGMPSKRIDNLNHIIQLQTRWTNRLHSQMELIRDKIAETGRQLRIKDKIEDENILAERLADILDIEIESCTRNVSKQPNNVILRSYVEYALLDNDELEELFSQMLGQ